MAYLEFFEGGKPARIEVQDTFLIGRDKDCDFVIASDAVSRHHTRIRRREEGAFLEDLDSLNGTFLNGRRMESAVRLHTGDKVTICNRVFRFVEEDDTDTAAMGVDLGSIKDVDDQEVDILGTLSVKAEPVPQELLQPEKALLALLDLLHCLSRNLDEKDLLPHLLDSLFRFFPQADHGVVLLMDTATGTLKPGAVRHRNGPAHCPLRLSRTILDRAVRNREAILSRDAATDAAFSASLSLVRLPIRALMCAPLVDQKNVILGVVQLHTETSGDAFTPRDLEVFGSIIHAAAVAVENANLHREMVEQDRLQRDLAHAQSVQKAFLPQSLPSVPGYDFHTHYEAAYTVGGDYYSFIDLGKNRLGIGVGDVSGKGVSAALLMAKLSSEVRAALTSTGDPGAALRVVNTALLDADIPMHFITLVLLVLDTRHHTLAIANAGHLAPLLRLPDGTVEAAASDIINLPLNIQPSTSDLYPTAVMDLEPGTTVLAYSDGITEAFSPDGRQLGQAPVDRILADSNGEPEAVTGALLEEIRVFAAGTPMRDDTTIVCFQHGDAGIGSAMDEPA